MEVDPAVNDEPVIQEENINSLQSNTTSVPVTSEPSTQQRAQPNPEPRAPERPPTHEENVSKLIEEEKDDEIKKLLEQMEEDQSMLVVDPPCVKPRSRAYRVLDVFSNRNIDSGNPITETNNQNTNPRNELTDILRTSLLETGFKAQDVTTMLEQNELPEDMVDHFRDVMREEIKARKSD